MTSSERYTQLLGIDRFPKTPDQLPQKVYLPAESLGDFEQAILETSAQNVEFLQRIDVSGDGFKQSRLYRGDHNGVHDGLTGLLKSFFGPKSLIHFHTHPTHDANERANYEFSSRDIAVFKAHPRIAYVYLCGSRLGIGALMQTEQSAKLPYSYIQVFSNSRQKLDAIHFNSLSQRHQAKLLKDMGFGYYSWRPNRKKIYSGDLNNGINLTRIQSRNL